MRVTVPPEVVLEETALLARDAPVLVAPAPGARHGPTAPSRPQWWLRAAECWHSAQRQPGPIALDMAVATAAAGTVTSSVPEVLAAGAAVLVGGLAGGLWRPRTTLESQGMLWLSRPALASGATVLGALVTGGTASGRASVAAAAAVVALLAVRALLWQVIGAARRRGMGLRPALVIASDSWGAQLRHRMDVYPEAGLSCIAVRPAPASAEDGAFTLAVAVERMRPAHVILAGTDPAVVRGIAHLGEGRFDCSVVVPVKGPGTGAHVGDIGVVTLRLRPGWGSLAAKRVFDVVASLLVLVACSPVLLMTAVAVRLADGGPVLFRQERVGRRGRVFTCLKFRSMVLDAEWARNALLEDNINVGLLFKLHDDPRITPVGRLIRRLSIDELPQLLNVLRGDMSLVGPRPLPVDPEDFDTDARSRHNVPPGITGLWQVHGGNALSYPDMLDLDFTYVTTRTLVLDLVLIARTIPALLIRRSAC